MSNCTIPTRLLERLKGLRALAGHATSDPQEAAAAAGRVQALLARYQLDPEAVEAALADEDGGTAPVRTAEEAEVRVVWVSPNTAQPVWLSRLSGAVARANGCSSFRSQNDNGRATLNFVGTPRRLDAATYIFNWLRGEVESLAKAASRTGKAQGRTGLNQYRQGVVDTLAERLAEAAKAEPQAAWEEAAQNRTADSGAALMRLDQLTEVKKTEDRAIRRLEASLNLRTIRSSRTRRDDSARAAGRQDGRSVAVGGARTALGAGGKRIRG